MRIVRFKAGRKSGYGIVNQKNQVQRLLKSPLGGQIPIRDLPLSGEIYPLEEVILLAPCQPSKIVCLGVNYRPHADEMGSQLPTQPLIFIKPSTALIGPDEAIVLPRHYRRVDYECELAVVIGRKAKHVSEEQARQYVLGYSCFNDVTERVVQKEDGQWTRAKGYDTFAPLGPWIETAIQPDDLKLETWLNGARQQSGRTSELLFGIPKLISFISDVMTLLPGDVIATGTPSGIGPVKSGDVVEIKIEGIGTLRNPVVEPD
jgi:2-keto-4-pentenoate hydratase/2-oxohepta-3-ene-1,7-dioic acid hydratase in catechol pathway